MTTSHEPRDGGLLQHPTADQSAEPHGTWAGDELQQAMRRIEALAREIGALENGLKAQREEIARLAETVQTVDGRTQRHESGQEIAREVREEVSHLDERLEAEAALRRDLSAAVSRQQEREQQLQQELQRALEVVATRLDEFDGKQAATAERQRALLEELHEDDREFDGSGDRLEALEHRIAALQESDRHAGQEVSRVASALTPLVSAIDALEARTRAILADQRRLDDDVAGLRAVRDREDALLEVIEQQRATRARLEDRVNHTEEALEELRQGQRDDREVMALLQRQLAGEVEQRRTLSERLEAQRDAIIEHLRRALRADEERARRQVDEIEREIRVGRSLITRLQEQSGEADQEQPL